MQRYACKFCICLQGLKGYDVPSLPDNPDEVADHIEQVHHYVTKRDGETPEDARRRFAQAYKDVVPCTALDITRNELAARILELTGPIMAVSLSRDLPPDVSSKPN